MFKLFIFLTHEDQNVNIGETPHNGHTIAVVGHNAKN